jgi:integrase/recombinase XerD
MYACGLRISEAAGLAVTAINAKVGVIRVIGKGDKERCVPLPAPVLAELRQLWTTHRDKRWLCPVQSGVGPVTRAYLGRIFRIVKAEAGIERRVTPHTLRHSYATRLIENGVELRIVQILLGHASIGTTAQYTHLTEPTRANLKVLLDRLMDGL